MRKANDAKKEIVIKKIHIFANFWKSLLSVWTSNTWRIIFPNNGWRFQILYWLYFTLWGRGGVGESSPSVLRRKKGLANTFTGFSEIHCPDLLASIPTISETI